MTPPFQLRHVIGRGAHGIVHVAYHPAWNKEIAVKKVPDNQKSRQEAWMLEELQGCPYIVRYYDRYFDGEGNLLIAMELCKGPTLRYLIDDVRRNYTLIPEEKIRRLAQCIGETVLHCHERGIMYGDIKSDNMIYHNDRVTMIDTGAVRYGDHFEHPLGTPIYFAPEKFEHNFGLISDVWSMGIIMYMLVCGHHPFVHTPIPKNYDGLLELNVEIESTPLQFHHPHWDHVSPELKHLLQGMLCKHASKRLPIEEVMTHSWWSRQL